jgi:Zn ribbon nucleic-acid-binding protein
MAFLEPLSQSIRAAMARDLHNVEFVRANQGNRIVCCVTCGYMTSYNEMRYCSSCYETILCCDKPECKEKNLIAGDYCTECNKTCSMCAKVTSIVYENGECIMCKYPLSRRGTHGVIVVIDATN